MPESKQTFNQKFHCYTVTREYKQQLHCSKMPQNQFHFSNIRHILAEQINTHINLLLILKKITSNKRMKKNNEQQKIYTTKETNLLMPNSQFSQCFSS